MKPSLNRTTIFKLIVHGTELREAFEETKNKRTLNFNYIYVLVNFFFRKIALRNVYKHKSLQIKTFMSDFSFFLFFFNPFLNSLYIFGRLSVRILLEFLVK